MIELKIDPEFQSKIPPLTDEEFQQLRENIINDGEVYEPICVWNRTIVDGHNRWKIIQEFPNIPFRIKEMLFADKWEAFEWMYRKQLGRRNLTDEQKTVLIGKVYEARKKAHGGDRGNQYTKVASNQNEYLAGTPGKTVKQIARELDVAASTVQRAEKFAKGVDALSKVSKEAADIVLQGQSGVSKKNIANLRNASEDERKDIAQKIISGTIKAEKAAKREMDMAIDKSVEAVRGESRMEYTLADALDELTVIENEFVSKVRRVLDVRGYLIKGNDTVKRTIGTWTYDIEKLKEEV